MAERDTAVAEKKKAGVTLSRNIDENQLTQLNDAHTEYRLASGKVGSYEADIIVFSRMEAEIRRNQQKIRFQRQAYESSFETVVYQEPMNMYNKQVPFPFNIIKLKIIGSQLRVENKMTDAVFESLQN
jgi:Ser-tRNA(Ala) deacylase AlaX